MSDSTPDDIGRLVLDTAYRAFELGDWPTLGSVVRDDGFVMTPASSGVFTSADAVLEDLRTWHAWATAEGATVHVRVEPVVAGASPSGGAVWTFDQVAVERRRDGRLLGSAQVRVTALLAPDPDWTVAAAYWSLPFGTQEEQDAEKMAGRLEPGITFDGTIAADVAALGDALRAALAEPARLPDLYRTDPHHVTIGSVTDEIFVGTAGRAAWQDFVVHVHDFTLRGPVRAGLVAPDAGWLVANIDIGAIATPYRFFYVWIRDEGGWRIALQHDAVSRDPRRLD
jgi:hypothetical protein